MASEKVSKFLEKPMRLFNMKTGKHNIKKTILFAPLDSLGHINSLVSIANKLRSLGHRTVFLFIEPIENSLKELGHEVYDSTTSSLTGEGDDVQGNDAAQDKWTEVTKMCQAVWKRGDIIENISIEIELGFGTMINDIRKYNANIEAKLKLIKPDLIILDHYFGIPALFRDNLPWVRIFSASPLALHKSASLPQAWLGLPTIWDKTDDKQRQLNDKVAEMRKKLRDNYNEYWTSFGLPDLPTEPYACVPESPYLNVYMYPEELDYSEFPLKNWQRCDSMVRDQKANKFKIPEKLLSKPGKLIFLSLGSIASADLVLMKRLTDILAESPHRFIVCKGPLHDQYELPDNMWGDKFVPQLEVLTIIDLIITHGGNNTLTESFFYGVPGFIVCPLFGDQFDNAQRIEERGLGIRLDPYNCSKEQLLDGIEKMLQNSDAKKRMKLVSKRMQKPAVRNKAIKLITDVVGKTEKQTVWTDNTKTDQEPNLKAE